MKDNRKNILFLLLIGTFIGAGCSKPVPICSLSILSPDKDMVLCCRSEFWGTINKEFLKHSDENIADADAEELSEEGLVKNIHSSLHVMSVPGSNYLRINMIVQKYYLKELFEKEGRKSHKIIHEYNSSDSTKTIDVNYNEFRDAKFVATIDPSGQIVASEILNRNSKIYWSKLEKDSQISQLGSKFGYAPFMLHSALEDSMAYLPPKGTQLHESWTVKRSKVLTHFPTHFGMIFGSLYFIENSMCKLQSIKDRDNRAIATITIRGKSIPQDPKFKPDKSYQVIYLAVEGVLEVNLNTGYIEKLQICLVPMWNMPDDILPVNFETKTVITLKQPQ